MSQSAEERLQKLQERFDAGLLTQEEYERTREAIRQEMSDGSAAESASGGTVGSAEVEDVPEATGFAEPPESSPSNPATPRNPLLSKPRNPDPDTPPSVNGTVIILMSCLSFVCGGFFLSLPALLMARSARSKIDSWETLSGRPHPEAGTVKAGFWVSAVNLGLNLAVLAFYVLIIAIAIITEL